MNHNKIYDIAILGLGPAGATFARLLDKQYSVIAFDKKSDKADSFKKPCGGLLADDAQRFFSKFSLTLPKDVMVDPQIFSVKTIDVKTKNVKFYQRFYINLDRHKFDMWLKSLIRKNTEVHDNSVCTKIRKKNDYYEIIVKEGESSHVYCAKYIVGADGADSKVRKFLYPEKNIRAYLAIQQWFEDKHETPFYSCIFDPDLTDCYAWGLTKDKYFIFGGAFPVKEGKNNFEKLKIKMKDFEFKLDNPIKTESCLVLRPANPFQFCCGKETAFLIGESAGFISPSSLEGMSYAFESAYILSEIFNKNSVITAQEYKKSTRHIRRKLTLKLLKNPFIYNPFLRKIVMKTSFQAIDVISSEQI